MNDQDRLAAIAELEAALLTETDADEIANINRTLEELRANEPLEMPTEADAL